MVNRLADGVDKYLATNLTPQKVGNQIKDYEIATKQAYQAYCKKPEAGKLKLFYELATMYYCLMYTRKTLVLDNRLDDLILKRMKEGIL